MASLMTADRACPSGLDKTSQDRMPEALTSASSNSVQLHNESMDLSRSGMGMELAIARTIVEVHGGRLSAENPAEAIFRLTLPAQQVRGTDR